MGFVVPLPGDLNWQSLALGAALFLASFTLSLLAIGFLLVRLPATYFLDSHPREFWRDGHPTLRLLGRVGKNLLGALLVLLGAVLSLPGVPGQGLLTILVGIVLLDLPGKRRLERAILRRPAILRTVNGLRARYMRPPLQVDERNVGQ